MMKSWEMDAGGCVLLVDDSENDIFLFRRAWSRLGAPVDLCVLRGGRDALDYFSGLPEKRARDLLPRVVVLDLGMPEVDGFEVLTWLRTQASEGCKNMPIVIFTSSDAATDREKATELGASDYLLKSADLTEISSAVQYIHKKWVRL
jgi:CheY-like chemotaxis protein